MADLRTIPRGRRVRGVTYGPAYSPPRRDPRRAPKALRHLPTRDRAEVTTALRRYRDARLSRQWHAGFRAFCAALPGAVRARVESEAIVAAALTRDRDPSEVLVLVEDDATGWVGIASRWGPR